MRTVRLFDNSGRQVQTVTLPAALSRPPDAISYEGRIYLLRRTPDGDDYHQGFVLVVR